MSGNLSYRPVAINNFDIDFLKHFKEERHKFVKDALSRVIGIHGALNLENPDPFTAMHASLSSRQWDRIQESFQYLMDAINPDALKIMLNLIATDHEEISRRFLSATTTMNIKSSFGTLQQDEKEAKDKWNEQAFENTLELLNENGQKLERLKKQDALIHNKEKEPYQPGMLDTLLNAFSYFAADHDPGDAWEASQTLQFYGLLFVLPFFLSSSIDDLVKGDPPFNRLNFFWWTVIAMAVTYVFIRTYKYCRPIPVDVKPFRNFTEEASEQRFDPLPARDDVISKIFTCWASSSRETRLHPLLVGSAGVGKTAIFTELARRIVAGDIPQTAKDILLNKKMFGGSTASLLSRSSAQSQGQDKLEMMLKKLERHKKDVILGLDEIHTFWLEQHASSYGELAKNLLDTSVKGFPFIIGATTPQDYKKYIACDVQRSRRFFVINIDPTNENQTTLILREMVRRFSPGVPIPEATFKLAYQLTSTNPKLSKYHQPDISKRMLTIAISVIKQKQQSSIHFKSLQEAQLLHDNLLEQFANSSTEEREKLSTQIKGVKENILKLNGLNEKYNDRKVLREKLQKYFIDSQERLYQLTHLVKAAKVNAAQHRIADDIAAEKELIFINYIRLPALRREILKLDSELAMPSIEEELHNVIEEFTKSEDKANNQAQNKEEGLMVLKGTNQSPKKSGDEKAKE